MSKFTTYSRPYNSSILKDLEKIDKDIKEEKVKEKPDKEKLTILRQEQLLKGMQLNINNNRKNLIPW